MPGDNSASRSVAAVAIFVIVIAALGGGWAIFGGDLRRDKNDIHIDLPGGKR